MQETYLRAWHSYASFENRSSLRAWLYRIATNACLTRVAAQQSTLCPPDSARPATIRHAARRRRTRWLGCTDSGCMGDARGRRPGRCRRVAGELAAGVGASMQHLPAQQRAVLLLRDVLAFPAAEVADMLGISVAAVKSSLHRARARIRTWRRPPRSVIEPTEPRARELLDQYMTAFEHADAALLEQALRHDAALEMVGSRTWFAGRTTCLPYIAGRCSARPATGGWWPSRQRPARRGGLPPRRRRRVRRSGSLCSTSTAAGIARIVVFGDPGLVTLFGLPLLPSLLEAAGS